MIVFKKGHNKKWKKKLVDSIRSELPKYSVVALANIEALPASVFRKYRELISKNGKVIVIKNKPVAKLLKEENIPLDDKIKGTSALILSNDSPFDLYRLIKENAGYVAAKTNSIADTDIEVPEGDTGIPAGPALSDFKALGLNTQIRGGKIYIASPKVVVKAGEKITEKIATVLNKLNIKPVKVAMKISGVFDKKESLLYLPEVLEISKEDYRNMLINAFSRADALTRGINYITKYNAKHFVAKAYNEAKAVAIEAKIINKETVKPIISKAYREAKALKNKVE